MELGDQKPHLLRRMRDLARDRISDATLRILWTNHLPPHIRSVRAVSDSFSTKAALEELALLADKMLEQHREVAAVSTTLPPQTSASQIVDTQFLINEIRKLSIEIVKLKARPSHQNFRRNRSRSRNNNPRYKSRDNTPSCLTLTVNTLVSGPRQETAGHRAPLCQKKRIGKLERKLAEAESIAQEYSYTVTDKNTGMTFLVDTRANISVLPRKKISLHYTAAIQTLRRQQHHHIDIRSGIELLFSRRHLSAVLGCLLVLCVGFMALPLSPYSGLTTQRHYWFHTQITTYDANSTATERTSGVLITRLDVNSVPDALQAIRDSPYYVRDGPPGGPPGDNFTITERDLTIITPEKCATSIYCGMPLQRPRFDRFNINSLFVTMSPPETFEHSLKLVNKTCTDETCVLNFVMIGAGYDTLTVSPRPPARLSRWSLAAARRETLQWRGRPLYALVRAAGTYSELLEPLDFSLTFSKPRNHTDALADVTHHAHRVHHPQHFTDQYKMLLDAMPDYFNIATYLSFRDNYVF
ncbi:unnamed protein product [Euphydryas editha]|uniref:Endoplasmic reticulum metallopeptidase 1-like C-terminal domain-containing protein n=1 Tax=Euphydryas editha TaxID=104508 RepID=A0AAU9ULG1_EUPED|nr:unnamed protein product [Euphydryas editha]